MTHRRLLAACVLVACGARSPADTRLDLDGRWSADISGLPPQVVRTNVSQPALAPVTARVWSFSTADEPARWCRRDVRDPEAVVDDLDPCSCGDDDPSDCLRGTLRLDDTVAPAHLVDVTLSPDGTRSDLVGVLAVFPQADHDVLGLHVVNVLSDPARRADATTGLQSTWWSGADGLGWYRRTRPRPGSP